MPDHKRKTPSQSALVRKAAHKRNVSATPIKLHPFDHTPPRPLSKFALTSTDAWNSDETIEIDSSPVSTVEPHTKRRHHHTTTTPPRPGPEPRIRDQAYLTYPVGECTFVEPHRLAYSAKSWEFIRSESFRDPTDLDIDQHCEELWRVCALVDQKLIRMGWCEAHDSDLFSTLLLHSFWHSTDRTTSDAQSLTAIAVQVRHMLHHFQMPFDYHSPYLSFHHSRPTLPALLIILGGILNLAAVFVDDHDYHDYAFPIFHTCINLYRDRYRQTDRLLASLSRWNKTHDEDTNGEFMTHLIHQASDLMTVQAFALGIYPRLSLNYNCDGCRFYSCFGVCQHIPRIPPVARPSSPPPPLAIDYSAIHYEECFSKTYSSEPCKGDCWQTTPDTTEAVDFSFPEHWGADFGPIPPFPVECATDAQVDFLSTFE